MTDASHLLDHVDFLRGLARSLLRDESGADDVVQEALVVAMERPDVPESRRRGWLAGVVRNLVRMTYRGRARAVARERLVGRREPAPAAAEVAARMELVRRTVDAVDALEERYRVVVVLRFHDGLRPFEIAERLGVPAATVRTRLRRALALLRGRLDDEHGGSRGAWALVLLPLAWPRLDGLGPAAPSIGGVLVKKVAVVMAVILLLLLLGGAIHTALRPGDGPEGADPAERRVAAGDPVAADPVLASAAIEPAESTATREPAPEPLASPPPDVALIVVRGADGRPIPGATVDLLRDGFEEFPINRPELVESRTADERGCARFTVVPSCQYELRVSHPDLCTAGDRTCFGGERTDFLLSKGGVLEGTVTDERSGRPVAGATVYVFDWSGGGALADWTAETDEAGRYRVEGIGPGKLNAWAWSPEHAMVHPAEVPEIVAGQVTTADFALPEGVRLTFRVLDEETREILPEAEVWSFVRRVAEGEGQDLVTRPLSTEFPRISVAVRAPGYLDEHRMLEVADLPRPSDPIPVAMSRGLPVRGRLIRDGGQPLVGVRLEVRSARSSVSAMSSRVATTDAEGRFEVRAAHPGGVVRLMVDVPPGGLGFGDEIAVPPRAEGLTIPPIVVEPERTISGIVLDEEGRPLAGESVNGRPADREGGLLFLGATDSRGRFLLRGLPSGRVNLSMWRGQNRAVRTLVVTATENVDVTWRLDRGLDIAGRVEFDDGTPVTRYGVRILTPENEFVGFALMDAGGRFRLSGLAPGRYRVEATMHPASALEDVPAGAEQERLVVPR